MPALEPRTHAQATLGRGCPHMGLKRRGRIRAVIALPKSRTGLYTECMLVPTLGDITGQPPPRSVWRLALGRRAGPEPLDRYLIRQANARGFHGAYVAAGEPAPLDPALTLEDIIVGLCAPQSPADGRVFKLVLRIVQSGSLDLDHLLWLARKEKADRILYWILERTPDVERTAEVQALLSRFGGPPRGARPVLYDYDPTRLIRRPFRRDAKWTRHGSS